MTNPVATSPNLRTTWRGARFPVGVLLLVALTAAIVVATTGRGSQGTLDPDAFVPQGARALAQVLRAGGVQVIRVDNVPAAVRGAGPGVVIFAPLLTDLTPEELGLLAHLPAELVVVAPTGPDLELLGISARLVSSTDVAQRRPACALPAANRAGSAVVGGLTYQATGTSTTTAFGCYASGGSAALLRLPDQRVTVLGSGTLFSNEELDQQGNAALALGLVGAQQEVRWLVPAVDRPRLGAARTRTLHSFVPTSLAFVVLQLGVVVIVLALWRARRLGRVVPELLPVVVRAAEAVEGRSRLYQAARASGAAAEQLRAGARHQLGRWLGAAGETRREVLVAQTAARTGRTPGAVDTLLYGAPPADGAALVQLAGDLDDLTREVADS